jgi:hypothetical protein
MTTNAVSAGTKRGIVFERSEAALIDAINEYVTRTAVWPDVIIVPIPLISEVKEGANVEIVCGIPVAICPSLPLDRVFVTDAQMFCDIKQYENERGMLNAH